MTAVQEPTQTQEKTTVKTSLQTPQYLHGSTLDDVARMVTGLTEELWVLRDRVMTLEKVLADAGVVTPGAVDELVPDAALEQDLATERMRLIRRVLGAPVDARG
jgi:hypothetical protein